MKLKAITRINLGGNHVVVPGEIFSIKDEKEADRFLDLDCVELMAEQEKAEEKAVSKTSPKKGTK